MKKLLSILALVAATCTLNAQVHRSQNILAVRAVATGTNGFGLTNLTAVVTNAGMVYSTNVVYTNLSGQVVRSAGAAGGTNSINTASLFADALLPVNRDGNPLWGTAYVPLGPTNVTYTGLTLFIELSSPNGSNAPIGLVFCPIWDGSRTDGGTTPTATTDDWSIVIPGGVGKTTFATNVPSWKWTGAESMRLRYITNQFILAGDAGLTNSAYITRLSVNGFVP